jgi:hypothetical protein
MAIGGHLAKIVAGYAWIRNKTDLSGILKALIRRVPHPKKKTFGEGVGLLAYRAVPRDDEAEQSSIGQTQTWELEWRTSSPWMCIQELAGTS